MALHLDLFDEVPAASYFENKFHVDPKNTDTMFHVACAQGNAEIVKYFIANGFDFNKKVKVNDILDDDVSTWDVPDVTGFGCACLTGKIHIVELLMKNNTLETSSIDVQMAVIGSDVSEVFYLACSYGHLNLIKVLKDWMDIDDFKENAKRGFPEACRKGALNIVNFLVNNGIDMYTHADIEIGIMGLQYACGEGRLPIIQYLIEKGCDPHVEDGLGTALEVACVFGQLPAIQYLVNNVALEDIDPWKAEMKSGLYCLLGSFSKLQNGEDCLFTSSELYIEQSILCLLEAGAELRQNDSLPEELKTAVKYRLIEIGFLKNKICEKFSPEISQLITDFTMLPRTNTILENLPQYLF